MRQIFSPTKDASIYEQFATRNTGHDEILEVGKDNHGTDRVRSLIQFDIAAISASIVAGEIPTTASFDLKLFIARAEDIQIGQYIIAQPLSASWQEGAGFFYQNVNTAYTSSRVPSVGFFEDDGTTWNNKQTGSAWTSTGSDYYTSSLSSSLADPVVDMTFDITTFMGLWLSGSIVNNGIVLKFPDNNESDHKNNGNAKFFSRQTHTVYIPQLIAKWNDQTYITGSISGSSPNNAIVVPKNISPSYRSGEVVRVDLSVRDQYPLKTFDTLFSAYAGNQRLPTSSYFSIIDVQSNTTIIPFDSYSTISSDGSGSYFNFRVEGMYSGRFYKVLVKVINQGYQKIYDSGHFFIVEIV